jgi:hypothetical protein
LSPDQVLLIGQRELASESHKTLLREAVEWAGEGGTVHTPLHLWNALRTKLAERNGGVDAMGDDVTESGVRRLPAHQEEDAEMEKAAKKKVEREKKRAEEEEAAEARKAEKEAEKKAKKEEKEAQKRANKDEKKRAKEAAEEEGRVVEEEERRKRDTKAKGRACAESGKKKAGVAAASSSTRGSEGAGTSGPIVAESAARSAASHIGHGEHVQAGDGAQRRAGNRKAGEDGARGGSVGDHADGTLIEDHHARKAKTQNEKRPKHSAQIDFKEAAVERKEEKEKAADKQKDAVTFTEGLDNATAQCLRQVKSRVFDAQLIIRCKHKGDELGQLRNSWCDFTCVTSHMKGIICDSSSITEDDAECLRVAAAFSLKRPVTIMGNRYADICGACFHGLDRAFDTSYVIDR